MKITNLYQRCPLKRQRRAVNEFIKLKDFMLYCLPVNSESSLSVFPTKEKERYEIDAQYSVVLSAKECMDVTFNGEWLIEQFTMSEITTLLSFLDYQASICGDSSMVSAQEITTNIIFKSSRSLIFQLDMKSEDFRWMLISGMLTPDVSWINSLFSYVRNIESYWVSRFLLSQLFNSDNDSDSLEVRHFSRIYGVSESYFRTLCRHAFSLSPKKKIRMWRGAKSILQLVDKSQSIATIAGNNGYSSSSHFSSEIKALFGITPREFKKLEGLLHE